MDKYPILKAISRYGKPGSVVLALVVSVLCIWLVWPFFGAASIVPALILGAFLGLIALSYVELVTIITEMFFPDS